MVPLRPLPSSKQSSSLRWLRQCSPVLFPENKFSGPPPCSRGLRCSKNFLFKEIFKGCCLLFSYQGSCRSFLATALIFYQIRFALSRTFLFFFSAVSLPSRSASSDSLYRLSHLQGVVNSFFHLFSSASGSFSSALLPRLFRLRVSGWHGFLRLFKAPSSATGAILSLREGIVNVFSVFYLFQTIHTILTVSFLYKGCHQP